MIEARDLDREIRFRFGICTLPFYHIFLLPNTSFFFLRMLAGLSSIGGAYDCARADYSAYERLFSRRVFSFRLYISSSSSSISFSSILSKSQNNSHPIRFVVLFHVFLFIFPSNSYCNLKQNLFDCFVSFHGRNSGETNQIKLNKKEETTKKTELFGCRNQKIMPVFRRETLLILC